MNTNYPFKSYQEYKTILDELNYTEWLPPTKDIELYEDLCELGLIDFISYGNGPLFKKIKHDSKTFIRSKV